MLDHSLQTITRRAQLWEAGSHRARPIAGPLQNEFMDLVHWVYVNAGQRPDLFAQIDAMLVRIRRGRGSASEELDFKTGLGGIIEAEFLVQALQMRAGLWNPQMIGALRQLADSGILNKTDAESLQKHYDYLRLVESTLRRWQNKSVSTVPADKTEQEKLAARVGAKSLDAFAQAYREARVGVHAIYAKYFRQR